MSTSSNTTFEFDVNHNGEFKLNPLTYQDGSVLNIHVFQMEFEDMVSYLKEKIPRGFPTLYYMFPPYYTLSGMKQIKNDYHTNVMYDIAKVAGKLQIFVSHTQMDLSPMLIPNDGSLEESFAGVISKETKIKLEESLSYLHQMHKRKKKFNYYELLVELGFINKTKHVTPYKQTVFNFVVNNNGKLVLGDINNTMYVNGGTFNINIPRLKLEDLKQYLINILGAKIHAL
nr:oligopeptide transporter [Tanacetum cinerariifolium]